MNMNYFKIFIVGGKRKGLLWSVFLGALLFISPIAIADTEYNANVENFRIRFNHVFKVNISSYSNSPIYRFKKNNSFHFDNYQLSPELSVMEFFACLERSKGDDCLTPVNSKSIEKDQDGKRLPSYNTISDKYIEFASIAQYHDENSKAVIKLILKPVSKSVEEESLFILLVKLRNKWTVLPNLIGTLENKIIEKM